MPKASNVIPFPTRPTKSGGTDGPRPPSPGAGAVRRVMMAERVLASAVCEAFDTRRLA